MTIEKLQELHERRPFEPFTIHMADGSSVAVRSPEFLLRIPKSRMIHVATGRGEEVMYIDLLLVSHITGGADGRPKRRRKSA
jgi:hypothetical protein